MKIKPQKISKCSSTALLTFFTSTMVKIIIKIIVDQKSTYYWIIGEMELGPHENIKEIIV